VWLTIDFMADIHRKPEWTDEQARDFALFDASRDPKEFLPEIYREASNADPDPDARVSKTLAKCSALFVRLSDEHAKAVHRLDVFTRWLIGLTIALIVLTAFQTCKVFYP
jgi:hypothetical protein